MNDRITCKDILAVLLMGLVVLLLLGW